jgi:prepilin-type N-terminal cleavage/methylation domain-containing protein
VSTINNHSHKSLVPILLKIRKYLSHPLYTEKGFTLIELLIVVAILGILAAVITVNTVTFLSSGYEKTAKAETKNLQTAVDGMVSDSGSNSITAVTGWDGSPATVTVTSSGITYDAMDYLRRNVTPDSTWDVTIAGGVICTKFNGNAEASFLARINT